MSRNDHSLQSVYTICKTCADWKKTRIHELLMTVLLENSTESYLNGYRILLQAVALLKVQDLSDEIVFLLVEMVHNKMFPQIEILLLGEALLWLTKSALSGKSQKVGINICLPLCGVIKREELVVDDIDGLHSLLSCFCKLLRNLQSLGDKTADLYALKFSLNVTEILIPVAQGLFRSVILTFLSGNKFADDYLGRYVVKHILAYLDVLVSGSNFMDFQYLGCQNLDAASSSCPVDSSRQVLLRPPRMFLRLFVGMDCGKSLYSQIKIALSLFGQLQIGKNRQNNREVRFEDSAHLLRSLCLEKLGNTNSTVLVRCFDLIDRVNVDEIAGKSPIDELVSACLAVSNIQIEPQNFVELLILLIILRKSCNKCLPSDFPKQYPQFDPYRNDGKHTFNWSIVPVIHDSCIPCSFDFELGKASWSVVQTNSSQLSMSCGKLCDLITIATALAGDFHMTRSHQSFASELQHLQHALQLLEHLLAIMSMRPDICMNAIYCSAANLSDCVLRLLEMHALPIDGSRFDIPFRKFVWNQSLLDFVKIADQLTQILSRTFRNNSFQFLSASISVKVCYARAMCSYFELSWFLISNSKKIECSDIFDIHQTIGRLTELALNAETKFVFIKLIYYWIVYILLNNIPSLPIQMPSTVLKALQDLNQFQIIISIHQHCPLITADIVARSIFLAAVFFLDKKPALAFCLIVKLVQLWCYCISTKFGNVSKLEEILTELEVKLCGSSLSEVFAPSIVNDIYFPLIFADIDLDERIKLFALLEKLFSVDSKTFSAKYIHLIVSNVCLITDHHQQTVAWEVLRKCCKLFIGPRFFEVFPLVVYDILTSDYVANSSYSAIFDSSLKKCLTSAGSVFYRDPNIDILDILCTQHNLIPIAWNLDANAQGKCGKALKILSTLMVSKQWNIAVNDKSWEAVVLSNVEQVLPSKFLHLMSCFVQHDWGFQKLTYKLQALNALSGLVSLFAPFDVIKYLPKILIIVDMAISIGCYDSLVSAMNLVTILMEKLPLDFQLKNKSTLVVLLYPFFDFRIFFGRATDSEVSNIRHMAVSLLNKILLRCQIVNFGELLLLPNVEELNNFRKKQLMEMESLSTLELWNTISKLLKHESSIVKRIALSRCRILVVERRHEFFKAFVDPFHNSLAFRLITELITIDPSDNDSEILLECAKCFGEIGAWDPSIFSTKAKVNQNLVADTFLPWDLSGVTFGVYLLSTFFIPGLKASQGSIQQDRWGFGIQQLLKELCKQCTGSCESYETMPKELVILLNQADIGEFCEPFWASKYKVSDSSSRIQLPFKDSQISFCRWIGNLSKYVIDHSGGQLSQIFLASRGVVRGSEELCQFILPYLIFDLIEREDERLLPIISEFQNVISSSDVNVVQDKKQTILTNDNCLKIQSIFKIVDCFNKWISYHLLKKPDSAKGVARLKKFVSQLSAIGLSRSAFSIGAFSRGLKYLEIDCRETDAQTKSGIYSHSLTRNEGKFQSRLSDSQLGSLSSFYVALDDQDGLIGVDAIKRISGRHSSIKDEILKHEQSDDWLPALLSYELIQNSQYYMSSLGNCEITNGNTSKNCSNNEIAMLERGKLKCLIELGHLENAIQQTTAKMELDLDLFKSVLPIGVEAAWKLMKWDHLNTFVTVADEHHFEWENENDNFSMSLGKIFSSLAAREFAGCISFIRSSQIKVMKSLCAASIESFTHSFPGICKLHILHDLESAVKLSKIEQLSTRKSFLESLDWNNQYDRLPTSIKFQNLLLSVRRSILGLAQFPHEVGKVWLQSCNFLRNSSRYDAARLALENARLIGVESEALLMEECKLLRAQGLSHRALMLLEPAGADLNTTIGKFCKTNPLSLEDQNIKRILAKRIHLGTKLMVESQQCHGGVIVERYRTVVNLDPHFDEAFYDFGKYYEYLYHDSMEKENDSQNTHTYKQSASSVKFFEKAIEKYGCCLKIDVVKTNTQVLPRLLTLWLSFTSVADFSVPPSRSIKSNNKRGQSTGDTETVDLDIQQKCNLFILQLAQETPPRIWFSALQQITSRVLHPNKTTVEVLENLLMKVLVAYPRQAIWRIGTLMYSLNADRRAIAKKLLKESYKQLITSEKQHAQMLIDSQRFFQNLISLAGFQTKDKTIQWKMDTKVNLENFVVPCEDTLLNWEDGNSASDSVCIRKFLESVDVASSKAKPKTFTFETIDGRKVRFLCKLEKDGDLRKDSHMMEINSTLNRLFSMNTQSKKRKLNLRTYAVVCLNEECGILEWVNNTECFRQIISQAHSFYADCDGFPHVTYKEVFHAYGEMQNKFEDDIYGLVEAYRNLLFDSHKYRPCLHRWFLERFSNPTEWFEGRTKYVRSAAVWSGVGHMIGLGDRHTENILIDVTNGECVHVDFDCLFDKGLTLLKPEIIPFRLTSNMIDAMGVIGVEGVFRISLETTLMVLRESKDILLSVLEPFLGDPTVAWSRRGRAQKNSMMSENTSSSKTALNANDTENKEAKEMLNKINGRLVGIYNLIHPHREKLIAAAKSRGDIPPSKGIGPSRDELLPLSVMGQAQRLIDEATAIENLAQLYIGWQSWL